MENKKVHWNSAILAINPKEIQRHDGTIIRTLFDDVKKVLLVDVIRELDSLERKITFSHYPEECHENVQELNPDEMPQPIKDLYQDFEVKEASELVGRKIVGLYFYNSLVGIRKIE